MSLPSRMQSVSLAICLWIFTMKSLTIFIALTSLTFSLITLVRVRSVTLLLLSIKTVLFFELENLNFKDSKKPVIDLVSLKFIWLLINP